MFGCMNLSQQSETVEIHHEADGETLHFATEADADAYSLTGDEGLVLRRTRP